MSKFKIDHKFYKIILNTLQKIREDLDEIKTRLKALEQAEAIREAGNASVSATIKRLEEDCNRPPFSF